MGYSQACPKAQCYARNLRLPYNRVLFRTVCAFRQYSLRGSQRRPKEYVGL